MIGFAKKYLLPGLVFQSIVIGGGYGTGRELVEFFLRRGPVNGYLGMFTAMAVWGLVLALGFELARMGKHYDYRSMMSSLLGRGWVVSEILYLMLGLITTAVVGSASGKLLNEITGWPEVVGTLILAALIALLTFWGSGLIEKFFSVWSMSLYVVYTVMIVLVARESGDVILRNMTVWKEGSGWLVGGLEYAAYNLGSLPAMLFALRHIERRREAIGAGVLAGVLTMFPGLLIYTAFLANYPAINEEAIPVNNVLSSLGMPWFQTFFQVILFGTFIETGTGMIHGFNERISGAMKEHGRSMAHWQRLLAAAIVLLVSIWLAERFGLVKLISDGYGVITYGFWLVFLLPIIVVGTKKILFGSRAGSVGEGCA